MHLLSLLLGCGFCAWSSLGQVSSAMGVDLTDEVAADIFSAHVPAAELKPKELWRYDKKMKQGIDWQKVHKYRNVLSDVLDHTGGRMLKQKKMAKQLYKFLKGINENWSVKDADRATYSLRIMLCHLRDKKGSSTFKGPPMKYAVLETLVAKVKTEANTNEDQARADSESEDIPEHIEQERQVDESSLVDISSSDSDAAPAAKVRRTTTCEDWDSVLDNIMVGDGCTKGGDKRDDKEFVSTTVATEKSGTLVGDGELAALDSFVDKTISSAPARIPGKVYKKVKRKPAAAVVVPPYDSYVEDIYGPVVGAVTKDVLAKRVHSWVYEKEKARQQTLGLNNAEGLKAAQGEAVATKNRFFQKHNL